MILSANKGWASMMKQFFGSRLKKSATSLVSCPSLLPISRNVTGVNYERERLPTPDRDCIDIDWSRRKSKKLAIVLHGYEGHSHRDHIMGMVKAFNKRDWSSLLNRSVSAWMAPSSSAICCSASCLMFSTTIKGL